MVKYHLLVQSWIARFNSKSELFTNSELGDEVSALPK